MSKSKRVTALITCMTDAERPYIEEAIDSVLIQTYCCDLVVLLNEESKLFDGLEEKYPNARFIRTSLRPIGEMRNFGLKYVSTEWVAYLDGDDVWYPTKISDQLTFADLNNADLIGCDHYLIAENSVPCACSVSHNIPMPSSWMVRQNLMLERPFSNIRVCEDGEWWVNNSPSIRAVRLSKFGLGYRVRGGSLSNTTQSKKRKLVAMKIASLPMLRYVVFGATWTINRFGKSDKYRWLKQWG